jgi:hypothetical protein
MAVQMADSTAASLVAPKERLMEELKVDQKVPEMARLTVP